MALKYGLQLDEPDFVGKAKAASDALATASHPELSIPKFMNFRHFWGLGGKQKVWLYSVKLF